MRGHDVKLKDLALNAFKLRDEFLKLAQAGQLLRKAFSKFKQLGIPQGLNFDEWLEYEDLKDKSNTHGITLRQWNRRNELARKIVKI